MSLPSLEPRERYSPHLRTALIFAGTGTAGAYHTGVLRALHEAGIKIDVVGGCGMGAASALFAAIDASAHLSEASSFWQSRPARRLYPYRPIVKLVAACLALSLLSVVGPLVAVLAALLVFPFSFLLGMFGARLGANAGRAVLDAVYRAFEPGALPSILPRVAVLSLFAAVLVLAVSAVRARRRLNRHRERASFWWLGVGGFLDAAPAVRLWRSALWRTMAGGAVSKQPEDRDLSSRYVELLADNLGQPGFRELLIVAHDVEARRDLVFGLLADRLRDDFFGRRGATPRAAEAFDLRGVAREQLLDVLAAALSLPVASEAHPLAFGADTYWRGETHRLTSRPESVARLIEEAGEAGATQVIVVSAAPDPPGPHGMREHRADPRSRFGDYLTSAEGASVGDALRAAHEASRLVFLIQPAYNPLNALDFGGRHDALSDRQFALGELVQRGYDDAYRQFIDPVVAAGGEHLGGKRETL